MGKFGALRILIYRDLQIRYAGTWLGYLWTLLDPLAMAFIYWLVFTQIIGAKNIGEQPYILFLLTGILSWTWFNGSVTDSARSLVVESKMVRSISIPRYSIYYLIIIFLQMVLVLVVSNLLVSVLYHPYVYSLYLSLGQS